jgi:hypothetical protein
VSSFLPVLRLGLVNPEGYIAFPLFPHLSDIPPSDREKAQTLLREALESYTQIGMPRHIEMALALLN